MPEADYILLGVTGGIGLIFIVISILLFLGKGLFLIAGFNMMSKEEKERYDQMKLSRFIGIITFIIGILTPLLGIGVWFQLLWVIWIYSFVVVGLSVFTVIFANTKNRFKRGVDNEKNTL